MCEATRQAKDYGVVAVGHLGVDLGRKVRQVTLTEARLSLQPVGKIRHGVLR